MSNSNFRYSKYSSYNPIRLVFFHMIDTIARNSMDVDQAVADIVDHLEGSFLISDLQKSLQVKFFVKKLFNFQGSKFLCCKV